jgi:hypothetical protein
MTAAVTGATGLRVVPTKSPVPRVSTTEPSPVGGSRSMVDGGTILQTEEVRMTAVRWDTIGSSL